MYDKYAIFIIYIFRDNDTVHVTIVTTSLNAFCVTASCHASSFLSAEVGHISCHVSRQMTGTVFFYL